MYNHQCTNGQLQPFKIIPFDNGEDPTQGIVSSFYFYLLHNWLIQVLAQSPSIKEREQYYCPNRSTSNPVFKWL